MSGIGQKTKEQRMRYMLLDGCAAIVAWFLFFVFRRLEIESSIIQEIQLFSPVYNFEKLLLGIPLYWLFVFWLSGYYNRPFRKSRLGEFVQTFVSVLLGSVGLFFLLLLDDVVSDYTDYYLSLIVLFLIYFLVVYSARLVMTSVITKRVHRRELCFNAVIVGAGKQALKICDELCSMEKSSGSRIVGFVSGCEDEVAVTSDRVMGALTDLERIVRENEVEEVIVAPDRKTGDALFTVINLIHSLDVDIRVIPDLYDYMVGGVRMGNIYGTPLVNVLDVRMPDWEQNVKRLFDICASVLLLLLFSPLFSYLALRVKLSSPGTVFYRQERVGLRGVPFFIYKFRSMYMNAEGDGTPQLSKVDDARITPFGRVMRRYRLDELPQFLNVLKGDMSIVGPRPERAYFEQRIVEQVPYYNVIHKVRPGITSWGMVMYGYADSVEKMVERLKYDIIYLENASLVVDLKILLYTIRTVIAGKGV